MADFRVSFGSAFDLAEAGQKFHAEMGAVTEINIGAPKYVGAYEVTPKAEKAQTLPTKNTILSKDVTVHAVPYYEADNKIGTTIFIASEV